MLLQAAVNQAHFFCNLRLNRGHLQIPNFLTNLALPLLNFITASQQFRYFIRFLLDLNFNLSQLLLHSLLLLLTNTIFISHLMCYLHLSLLFRNFLML
jgi:hypothetical protein